MKQTAELLNFKPMQVKRGTKTEIQIYQTHRGMNELYIYFLF